MIPLRDNNPRLRAPVVTILLIVANVLVFLYEVSLPTVAGQRLVMTYGMIPARAELFVSSGVGTAGAAFLPFLTSMFLHGGWLHIIGNMWFLWVFGDNVEDRMGHAGFLVFYLVCGVGAGLIHTVINTGSTVPAVGASGAISGVLGAYFLLFPGARVVTLIPLGFLFFTARLPALVLLGWWLVIQLVSGVAMLGGDTSGGVAWWAHIGGFGLGLVAALLFRRPQPKVAW